MTKLTREKVLDIARLSRLHLTDDEIEKFRIEIETILNYVEQLQSVDLDNLSPTNQVTGLSNVMRHDEIKDYGVTPDELLKNLPNTEDGQIKVRRMLI